MSMVDELRHVVNVDIPSVRTGEAKTVDSFFRKFVKPNELDFVVVRKWCSVLEDYANNLNIQELVLFVRKMEHEQRRGFVSRTKDGLSYVFSDNSLAKVIDLLARRGFAPESVDDFRNCVRLFKLKCMQRSYGDENARDAEGRYYSTFRKGSLPSLHGWFLAHVHSVNEAYLGNYMGFERRFFTRGELQDWTYAPEVGCIVRKLGSRCTETDRKFFVAHFLRFLVPMNHFLVPLPKHMGGNPAYKDISSTEAMLGFMRQIRARAYGDFWVNFEKMTLCLPYSPDDASHDYGSTVINGAVYDPEDREHASSNSAKQRPSASIKRKRSAVSPKDANARFAKALARIPRWAANPACNPHRIIKAYFLAADVAGIASAAEVRRLCTQQGGDVRLSVPKFSPSWRDLTHPDTPQSYGRVFVQDGDEVRIWPPVAGPLIQYRGQFLA